MDMSNEARVTATFALPLDNITVQAPSPDLLSQRNVEAITGIPQRAFLETIRSPSFPLQVTKMGALRIVDRVAFVRWVREGARLTCSELSDPSGQPEETVESFLGELGLELTAPRAVRKPGCASVAPGRSSFRAAGGSRNSA